MTIDHWAGPGDRRYPPHTLGSSPKEVVRG